MKKVCEHCGSTYLVEEQKLGKHEHNYRIAYRSTEGDVKTTTLHCPDEGCDVPFKTVDGHLGNNSPSIGLQIKGAYGGSKFR